MTIKLEDREAEQMKDPRFQAAVEELEPEYQIERLLIMLSGILRHLHDEDGTYIVDDYKTVVYGDGETLFEALRDYIVSLIEYSELLIRSQPVGERLAIKSFVDRVCKRAEENMERTGKLEGSHYNAMLVELKLEVQAEW